MVYSSSQNAGALTDRSTAVEPRGNTTSGAPNAGQSTAVSRNDLSGSRAPILTNSNIGTQNRPQGQTTLTSPRPANAARANQNSIARQPASVQQQTATRRLSNTRNNDASRANPRYVTAPANAPAAATPTPDIPPVRARPRRPTGVARQTASLTSSRREVSGSGGNVGLTNRNSTVDARVTTLHRARDTSNRLQVANTRLTSQASAARQSHVSSISGESHSRTTSSSGEPGVGAGESKPPHQTRTSVNRANANASGTSRARASGGGSNNNNHNNSGSSGLSRPRRRNEILDQINQNNA